MAGRRWAKRTAEAMNIEICIGVSTAPREPDLSIVPLRAICSGLCHCPGRCPHHLARGHMPAYTCTMSRPSNTHTCVNKQAVEWDGIYKAPRTSGAPLRVNSSTATKRTYIGRASHRQGARPRNDTYLDMSLACLALQGPQRAAIGSDSISNMFFGPLLAGHCRNLGKYNTWIDRRPCY